MLGLGFNHFLSSTELQKLAAQQLEKSFKTLGFYVIHVDVKQAQWGGFWNPLFLDFGSISGEFSSRFPDCKVKIQQLQLGLNLFYFFKKDFLFNKINLKNVNFTHGDKVIARLSIQGQKKEGLIKLSIDDCSLNPGNLQYLNSNDFQPLAGLFLPLRVKGDFLINSRYLLDFDGDAPRDNWINFIKKTILVGDCSLNLDVPEAIISVPPFYPIPLSIHRLKSHFHMENCHFSINSLELTQGKTSLTLKGDIDYRNPDSMFMQLNGQAKHIPADHLSVLWPVGLATSARTWVVENISVGCVENATILMEGMVCLGATTLFEIKKLSGIIEPENMTVRYMENLPLARQVNGHCQYTKDNFCIQAQGKVNGLTIEKGDIIISDFDELDQQININLLLSGPVGQALDIIARDPLNLTQKLGIDHPKIFKGNSLTTLTLDFPLIRDLPLEKVKVLAKSEISNGYIDSETPLVPVSFADNKKVMEKASFQIVVDNHQLSLEGKAHLINFPSEIHWIERFSPAPKDYCSEWQLNTLVNLDTNDLSTSFYQGKSLFKIVYKVRENKSGTLSLRSDLKNVRFSVPYLLLLNDYNDPLDLSIDVSFDKDYVIDSSSAILRGPSISLCASGDCDFKSFKKVVLDVQKFGNLQGQFILTGPYTKPLIRGHIKQLDLRRILSDPTVFDPPDSLKADCELDLKVDKILVGDKLSFDHIVGQLHWANDHLQSVHLKGKAPELFELMLAPPKYHEDRLVQQFSFVSSNAGDLLDCFYPHNDLEGGIIHMAGVRREDHQKKATIEAELDIRDVMVKKAPFLAQLLSAASFEGFFNTLSGSGIQFDHCTGNFNWTPESLELRNIYFSGGSLGLQVEGFIYEKKLDLKGELYPFNGLNYLLANIPIVGTLLSGGNKVGVFSTSFTAVGKRENPCITINPLTTITPSGIRQVMPDP